jgi:uncharacterized Fe-S cluster-containing protein
MCLEGNQDIALMFKFPGKLARYRGCPLIGTSHAHKPTPLTSSMFPNYNNSAKNKNKNLDEIEADLNKANEVQAIELKRRGDFETQANLHANAMVAYKNLHGEVSKRVEKRRRLIHNLGNELIVANLTKNLAACNEILAKFAASNDEEL